MSMELPVLARERTGTVRVDTETMADLGLEPGDAVTLGRDGGTVAVVDDPFDGNRGVRVDPDLLAEVGGEVGETIEVAAADGSPAESVTLAPPGGFGFESVEGALRDALEGRTVVRGDEVRPKLFGGSLEVTFVVVEVAPAEPGVVTAETDVAIRDRSAGPVEVAGVARPGYDDVGGTGEVVDALRRSVTLPMASPGRYRELAGRPPTGVLLTGPPGGGKTFLADVVGSETDARYLRVPDRETVETEYERGFDSLAVEAARSAPTIVLLDDVDVMVDDGSPGDDGGDPQIEAFLDAVEDRDIVVIGTATHPDELGDSLRRGGRFDHEIEIEVPDRNERLDILRVLSEGIDLAPEADLASIADRTHGYVAADLRSLLDDAVRHAVERTEDGGDETGSLGSVVVTGADLEAALDAVTPSGMQGFRIEHPDVSYRDIGGLDAAKREVVRAVEWPLRYPELLDRVATTAPTGVLLHGLPGTGKTMLARAVANATDANFIAVEGPELLDRYVGESERGVREVFDRAARNAPTVLFFDELDALAPERGGDSDTDVTERVVSQFLTELDGVEPREGVVVIGATNRPDMIDPALLRPGRLERVVEVPMPDRAARAEIFRSHAREVPVFDVDFDDLADRTEGYSGSDIEAIVREAGLLAVEEKLRAHGGETADLDPGSIYVREPHFDRALDVISPSVSEEMRERYADRTEEVP